MALTTEQAAAQLKVNQSRVRALIAAGGLKARRIGRQWMVDADSLDQQAALIGAGATGRPMAKRIAWAAADLADGGSAEWLSSADRSRLRGRLSSVMVAEVAQRWLSSRSDQVQRYRVGVDDLEALLTSDGVVRTGVSAVETYGPGLATSGSADAYVDDKTAVELVQDFFLVESAAGNLTLRVVRPDYHLISARTLSGRVTATRLIVGADLADEAEVRTRAAGLRLITAVLSELRGERG